jgi:hypothetical protein
VKKLLFGVVLLVGVSACATKPAVRLDEPRRVVGTENSVRVDAEILVDATGNAVSIKYEVTNGRPNAIAVADIVPETSFDLETRTVTVSLGSEVPGAQLLPRLMTIPAGQKRSFTAGANVRAASRRDSPFNGFGTALRLKLNFLGKTDPFRQLLDIQEKAVNDPELADALFPTWLELNESVITNSIPVRADGTLAPVATPPDVTRRR